MSLVGIIVSQLIWSFILNYSFSLITIIVKIDGIIIDKKDNFEELLNTVFNKRKRTWIIPFCVLGEDRRQRYSLTEL